MDYDVEGRRPRGRQKKIRSQLIEKKIIRPHKNARKLLWTIGMEEFSYRCCIIAIKTE